MLQARVPVPHSESRRCEVENPGVGLGPFSARASPKLTHGAVRGGLDWSGVPPRKWGKTHRGVSASILIETPLLRRAGTGVGAA